MCVKRTPERRAGLAARLPFGFVARKSLALIRTEHQALVADVVRLIEAGRAAAARSVNSVMTATYWHVGRVIVERELRGAHRAEYGAAILERLGETLTLRYGRGFSRRNLDDMRRFYLAWPIRRTLSAKSIRRTLSAKSDAPTFLLPWSHYVRLLDNPAALAADRDPVLRAHRALPKQGGDACAGREAEAR
jgi:hypothetical protein